jgi:hypothetical protein
MTGLFWRRGQEVKAGVCKTPIRQFESARRLFTSVMNMYKQIGAHNCDPDFYL